METFVSIGALDQLRLDFPKHQHTTWEIVLYTHGTGTATVGDAKIPFAPGTIVCMPPHLPHSEVSHDGFRNVYIHSKQYPRGDGRVPVVQDQQQTFSRTAKLLREEFDHRQPGSAGIIDSLFSVLLALLQRWDQLTTIHPEARALRDWLDQHYADPGLTISSAMSERSLSPGHLRQQFVAETGMTPHAYLNMMRMNRSQVLLGTTGMSVRQCARAVGFTDPLYFSKCFKRAFGVSPGSWTTRQSG
ncbi:MAG: AraC family transcriptional regulator [Planctomycetota bacterium]